MSPPDTRAISLRSGEIAGSANEGSGAMVLDSWPLWLDIPSGCIAPSSASPAIASDRLVNPAAIPAACWLAVSHGRPPRLCLPALPTTARWVCEKTVSPSYDGSSGCNLAEPRRRWLARERLDVPAKSNFSRPLKVKEKQRMLRARMSPPHDTRPLTRTDSEQRLSFDARLAHTRIRKAERNGWDSMAAAALAVTNVTASCTAQRRG